MKVILLLCLSIFTQNIYATELKNCELVLQGKDVPDKNIKMHDSTMVDKACEGFANLFLRQNEKQYQQIRYHWGSNGQWKLLKLEDVVDEVAHP
jgi:hypothetical protein